MNKYNSPYGYEGIGSDIKWCHRIRGRKKCGLCYKYAELDVWAQNWNWYYLLKWNNYYWGEDYAHFKFNTSYRYNIHPAKYQNTGLKDFEIKSLLRKGCKNNKRCRCMNIVQRAFWYCQDCYRVIKSLAKIERRPIHDLMLFDRNELKAQILILRLSGSI